MRFYGVILERILLQSNRSIRMFFVMGMLSSLQHSEFVPIKDSKIKDAFSLMNNPTILKYVQGKTIHFRSSLHDYYVLLTLLENMGSFVLSLDSHDRPSEKIREYFEKDFQELVLKIEEDNSSTMGEER